MVNEPPAEVGPSSRNLREVHLDFLLLEELETNLPFARYVFELAFTTHGLPAGLPSTVNGQRSVWDVGGDSCPVDKAGENDLDVIATWEQGVERRLLIEDKVRASFQVDQPLRYLTRASSRPPHTRCLLVAPHSFVQSHPEEVKVFEECGAAVAIEALAEVLKDAASEAGGQQIAPRLEWRAKALLHLASRPASPPDHPPTVAFTAWCMQWLAEPPTGVVPLPQYTRTENGGWMYFGPPEGLIWKCINGRVDLQVSLLGPDWGVEVVRRRVGEELQALGFTVTADGSNNTVLRYECERVSPQRGLIDGEPVQSVAVTQALSACAAIARWLDNGGRVRLIADA